MRAYDSEPEQPQAPATTPEQPPEQPQEQSPEQPQEAEAEPEPEGPLATDAARILAQDHHLDLSTITGTGVEGRITKDDVAAVINA